MTEPTEAELLKQAADEGRVDNPSLDPPDVAEVDTSSITEAARQVVRDALADAKEVANDGDSD